MYSVGEIVFRAHDQLLWTKVMLRKIVILFATLCLLQFSAAFCGATAFRLGVINERPGMPDFAINQYAPLCRYLEKFSKENNISVELVIVRSMHEMVDHIQQGKVDAVFEGLLTTLSMNRQGAALEPSLLVWRKGQRQYYSVFFVRCDSTINKLDDLAGKSIAFESARSTSAFLVPKTVLQVAGMPVVAGETSDSSESAVSYFFAGSELNQAYWVERGRVDAGAFNNGDWQRVPEKVRNNLKIIYSTRPVLRWLCSFTPQCNSTLRATVTPILEKAHNTEEGREALQKAARIKRFERLTEQDRDNLLYWENALQAGK